MKKSRCTKPFLIEGRSDQAASVSGNLHRFEIDDRLQRLLNAGVCASSLGVAVLDSQTRFESVNDALARETRAEADQHIGKTSREVVGDLAKQIEPTYEKVLRTRKALSVFVKGKVRDTPEFGYWSSYCFPIIGRSGLVQKLGLFVVNTTAEEAAIEIIGTLTTDSKRQLAGRLGLLTKFNESIRHYRLFLRKSFQDLACHFTETCRKADPFHSSVEHLDYEIDGMRELIYSVISQFSVPRC